MSNLELNLLTSEEKFEQQTSLIFKIVNSVFALILVLVISFSIYCYLENKKLMEIENSLVSQKDELVAKISSLKDTEKTLRQVIYRYGVYNKFESQIIDFSEIIKEIYIRSAGTNVSILTINFNYESKEASIRVSSNSEEFTRFVNNLKNQNFKESGSIYPNILYPSEKNEEVDQTIKEYIVYIKYRPELIKK